MIRLCKIGGTLIDLNSILNSIKKEESIVDAMVQDLGFSKKKKNSNLNSRNLELQLEDRIFANLKALETLAVLLKLSIKNYMISDTQTALYANTLVSKRGCYV